MCEVECEGLAFHELGKIGYKYALDIDTCELDMRNWQELGHWYKEDGTPVMTEPRTTLQYWCEKCGLLPASTINRSPNKWYYSIQMDWNAYENTAGSKRQSNILYEDAYTSSWTIQSNKIVPNSINPQCEKQRIVEIKESNIYNITQTIAEAFQVFCRYEYTYDPNYQIVDRTIVFYNNYIDEKNAMSLTYPYHSKEVKRELDSVNITTKMYVREEDSDQSLYGTISIANTEANPTKEDYILNFDYMKTIGAITQDQYNYIDTFNTQIRAINTAVEDYGLQLVYLNQQKIDADANVTFYDNSRKTASEQKDQAGALFDNLTSSDGTNDGLITRDEYNPYSAYVKTEDGTYTIAAHPDERGIQENTVQIYKTYNSATHTLSNQISSNNIQFIKDEYDMTVLMLNAAIFIVKEEKQ